MIWKKKKLALNTIIAKYAGLSFKNLLLLDHKWRRIQRERELVGMKMFINKLDRIDSVKLNRNSYVILLIKLINSRAYNPTKMSIHIACYVDFKAKNLKQTTEMLQMEISHGMGDT